ncbi:flavin reductase family protein [Exilibacterium tricleocarpae]|nr:flavin reductase family protein [Exilibacterium tricleocarpae]
MQDSRTFRQTLSQFATGVTVITAKSPSGKPIGMTANSFSSLSLDPPLVLWSIARSSGLYTEFVEAKHYAIHVLKEGQQQVSHQFSRRNIDRFEGVPYQFDNRGVPLLNDCLARFSCEAFSHMDGGDHTIIVGRVIDMSKAQGSPLIFHGGSYGALAS